MSQANPSGPYIYKEITSSGVVTTAGIGGYLKAFGLKVTTAAGEIIVKDGGSGGTNGPSLTLDAATAKNSISSGDIGPVRFNTDIYGTLSGTDAVAWFIYNQDSD